MGSAESVDQSAKLSQRDERRLLRLASNSPLSSAQLTSTLDLPISASRTRAYLTKSVSLRHMKVKHAPALSQQHKDRRIRWARAHVKWSVPQLGKVVFSDEKRFNLDGPDGFNYYWHDIRKPETVLSRRQNGGGGIMVWGAFSAFGVSKLALLKGRQNTQCYLKVMDEYLLHYTDDKLPVTWIYQQDNAPIHVSQAARSWFSSQGIRLMDWPSRSPDLNPIENVWGWLARAVYAENRQFLTVSDLTKCVMEQWDKMPGNLTKKLIFSMQQRALEILERQGLTTHY